MTNEKTQSKIRYYRKRAGMTLDELGQRLGLCRQTISLWELGRHQPRRKRIDEIAEVLQLTDAEKQDLLRAEGRLPDSLIAALRDPQLGDVVIDLVDRLMQAVKDSPGPGTLTITGEFEVGAGADSNADDD